MSQTQVIQAIYQITFPEFVRKICPFLKMIILALEDLVENYHPYGSTPTLRWDCFSPGFDLSLIVHNVYCDLMVVIVLFEEGIIPVHTWSNSYKIVIRQS